MHEFGGSPGGDRRRTEGGFGHLSQRELLELKLEFLRMSDLFDARTNEVLAAVSRREVHRSIKEVSPGMAVANRTRISSRLGDPAVRFAH